MRLSELLEALPDYSVLRRRLGQRVTDLWNQAADDPAEALAEARRLHRWLLGQSMAGEADRVRRECLAELYELIRFLQ